MSESSSDAERNNEYAQRQLEAAVPSPGEGFDSPFGQPEDLSRYRSQFGVRRRRVHPTNDREQDNPGHSVDTDVAINPDRSDDIDNLTSAVGGVTEITGKTADGRSYHGGNVSTVNIKLQLTYRTTSSKKFDLPIDIPVLELKKYIERELKVPQGLQSWFYNNTELDNNKTLVGNNIHSENLIHVKVATRE